MQVRILSGIVGIGLWLGLCFAGLLPFAIGVAILAALAAREWAAAYGAAQAAGAAANPLDPEPPSSPGVAQAFLSGCAVALPILALFLSQRHLPGAPVYEVSSALLVGLFALRSSHAERTGEALGRWRARFGLVGLAYIGMLFGSFVLLRGTPGRMVVAPFPEADRGAWLMLLVAVCVWATDTCAYCVGRALGRRSLAPRLSPKKTVEGSFGGLLGALLAGALFAAWLRLPAPHGLALGAIAGIVGQMGDLFESALKREIGLKDFGGIMPGHGGVLDRFDSLLFVTPLATLYLRLALGG